MTRYGTLAEQASIVAVVYAWLRTSSLEQTDHMRMRVGFPVSNGAGGNRCSRRESRGKSPATGPRTGLGCEPMSTFDSRERGTHVP